MRKLAAMGLATLITAGTVAIGAGVAHADTFDCTTLGPTFDVGGREDPTGYGVPPS